MSLNISVPEELIQDVSDQNVIVSGHSQLVDVSCQHLEVSGTINSSKWNAIQILNNLNNLSSLFIDDSYTAATNITIHGGTLIFYITCGGFTDSVGKTDVNFYLNDSNGNNLYIIEMPFFHNQISTHSSWSKSEVVNGLDSQYIDIVITRTSNLVCDGNDFFTITLLEFPF